MLRMHSGSRRYQEPVNIRQADELDAIIATEGRALYVPPIARFSGIAFFRLGNGAGFAIGIWHEVNALVADQP